MTPLKFHTNRLLLLFFILATLLTGCGDSTKEEAPVSDAPLRDNTPQVLTPEASGAQVVGNETVSFDISNIAEGYTILTYHGSNEKVKLQIAAPDDVTSTYLVTSYGEPMVFPLTGGDGDYTFILYEAVDAENNKYAIAFTHNETVVLSDKFLPFLTPNVYVNFQTDSKAVEIGTSLVEDCTCELDVIEDIYYHVTESIVYDEEKAQSVSYGYVPDPDETLASGKGICFDYASLMTTMLRSQRIPTKLEVGYAGDVYHAWISCYVEEIGWVDNIIEFNGESWSLMDPTLAANNSSKAVQEYIGDGSKYLVKYTY